MFKFVSETCTEVYISYKVTKTNPWQCKNDDSDDPLQLERYASLGKGVGGLYIVTTCVLQAI